MSFFPCNFLKLSFINNDSGFPYANYKHPKFTLCIQKLTLNKVILCIPEFTLCIIKLLYAPIFYFMHPKNSLDASQNSLYAS